MNWQRARKPDQKAERIVAILEASADLFDKKGLGDTSMRDIAQESGLSKASLYSYFKTKEEVFATLFLQETEAWFSAVDQKIRRLRSPNPQRVAKILTDILRERERLCRLSVVLASVLEHNLSKEFIRDFKLEVRTTLGQAVVALQTALPKLTTEAGTEFLYQHHALISGLWPLTHPAPDVAEVLAGDEFQDLQIDFHDLFQRSLERLLAEFP